MTFNVADVIEQLTKPIINTRIEDTDKICECSLGFLNYNTLTDRKYSTNKGCNKKFVCYFVASEKHKSRISTKYFIKNQEYQNKLKSENSTKIKVISVKKVKKKGQNSLFDYL